MIVPLRAALYLRVSTARQAEHDVSIPDQKRQGEAYCQSRGYQLAETYVEPGASATNDRRPEFQRMIEAGISKPASFDVVIVHSFSRFFRDHFELDAAAELRDITSGEIITRPAGQTLGPDSAPCCCEKTRLEFCRQADFCLTGQSAGGFGVPVSITCREAEMTVERGERIGDGCCRPHIVAACIGIPGFVKCEERGRRRKQRKQGSCPRRRREPAL
jgi:hypothetical protein